MKDERLIDRFDRVFALYFRGLQAVHGAILADIPEEWLKQLAERFLTEEERAAIERLGGLEKLLETLRQRLAEQQGRHEGGSKWIGTAGTSPFGAYGDNPEGVRIGQAGSRRRSAVKVWDKREFRDLDGEVELGTRTLKLALRRLRRWAREGEASELDLGGTIHATAANGGSPRPADAARAPQQGEGAAAARYRRVDGRFRRGIGAAVLRRAGGVQASRDLLFPQLPVREPVAQQPPPPRPDDADARR